MVGCYKKYKSGGGVVGNWVMREKCRGGGW